jgi:hypothetical protein
MSVDDALRAGLESGDFGALGECYTDDAVLDLNVRGGRERVAGPVAIVARLERLFRGPGRLVEWTAARYDAGAAVWLERVSDDDGAVLRQRQYLLLRDGRVARHFAYTAPHRTGIAGAGGRPALDPALIEDRGDIAEHTVLASRGWSGNAIERVVLADGRVLIAKRVVPGADWIGRASADPGREGLLFTSGVLDRLPPALDHAIVAAARDGDAWWLVMRDVSEQLLDDHSIVPRAANRRLLAAVNEMWESFWGEHVEFLTPQAVRLQMAAPSIGGRERDGIDLLPKQFEVMWEAFAEAVDPDVASVVLALLEDPAPLAAALDARGTTLLHGDIRDEQIGLAGRRLVLLDWGLATQGHPVVDYAWHLMHSAWRIDATHDQLWEDFRAERGERDDPLAIELGTIAGLMMYGWILGHSAVIHPDPAERIWARAELDWWVPRARQALETWSPPNAALIAIQLRCDVFTARFGVLGCPRRACRPARRPDRAIARRRSDEPRDELQAVAIVAHPVGGADSCRPPGMPPGVAGGAARQAGLLGRLISCQAPSASTWIAARAHAGVRPMRSAALGPRLWR